MPEIVSIDRLQDAPVHSSDGHRLGSVGQIYLDDATDEPTFVTIRSGLLGRRETFVPLAQVAAADHGFIVPFDKAFVLNAPRIHTDGSLTPEEERQIYAYYAMDPPGDPTDAGDADEGALDRDPSAQTGHRAGVAGGAGVGQTHDFPAGTVAGEHRRSGWLRKHTGDTPGPSPSA